jgi:hypothetical protein
MFGLGGGVDRVAWKSWARFLFVSRQKCRRRKFVLACSLTLYFTFSLLGSHAISMFHAAASFSDITWEIRSD